jgi:hypothetical protein
MEIIEGSTQVLQAEIGRGELAASAPEASGESGTSPGSAT